MLFLKKKELKHNIKVFFKNNKLVEIEKSAILEKL